MSVGNFGISEGNITRKKKKKTKPTEYAPNYTYYKRSDTDVCIHQQRVGAGQAGTSCIIGP